MAYTSVCLTNNAYPGEKTLIEKLVLKQGRSNHCMHTDGDSATVHPRR